MFNLFVFNWRHLLNRWIFQGKRSERDVCHQGNGNKVRYFALTSKTHPIVSLSLSLSFNQRAHLNFMFCELAVLCQQKKSEKFATTHLWNCLLLCRKRRTRRSKTIININSSFYLMFNGNSSENSNHTCIDSSLNVICSWSQCHFRSSCFFLLLFIGLKSIIIFDWVRFFVAI